MNEQCVIYSDLEQGSEEWLRVRAGVCTSSEKGLMAAKTGFATYLIQKEAELHLDVFEEGYSSDAMKNGTELEPIARDRFAEEHLLEIEVPGFVLRPDLRAGWSPDGLIKDADNKVVSFIEIKCRQPVNHFRVFKNGIDAPTYNQMQFAMAITDLPYGYFVGFNPDFKPGYQLKVIKIERSEAVSIAIKASLKNVKNILDASILV